MPSPVRVPPLKHLRCALPQQCCRLEYYLLSRGVHEVYSNLRKLKVCSGNSSRKPGPKLAIITKNGWFPGPALLLASGSVGMHELLPNHHPSMWGVDALCALPFPGAVGRVEVPPGAASHWPPLAAATCMGLAQGPRSAFPSRVSPPLPFSPRFAGRPARVPARHVGRAGHAGKVSHVVQGRKTRSVAACGVRCSGRAYACQGTSRSYCTQAPAHWSSAEQQSVPSVAIITQLANMYLMDFAQPSLA